MWSTDQIRLAQPHQRHLASVIFDDPPTLRKYDNWQRQILTYDKFHVHVIHVETIVHKYWQVSDFWKNSDTYSGMSTRLAIIGYGWFIDLRTYHRIWMMDWRFDIQKWSKRSDKNLLQESRLYPVETFLEHLNFFLIFCVN